MAPAIEHVDGRDRGLLELKIQKALLSERCLAPSTLTVWPTKPRACVGCVDSLQRNERGQLVVLLELLLDLRELHELLGELVGVERVERVLVLELRRQQCQEGLEIRREPSRCPSRLCPWCWTY